MNFKLLSISSFAGAIAMWLLAGLWHKVIMVQFYTNATQAKHEGAAIILFSYIILSFLISYLFSRMYRGGSYAIEGLKLGALVGFLWVFPHELAMAGAHGESLAYVFKNGVWHIVEQAFGGVIIGWTYGKLST